MPHAKSSADVLIVGSGAAGVTAALEASLAGADVLVLEALSDFGGTAATSGGGTCIAGSPLQKQLGVHDSPAIALEDWLAFGGSDADAVWAERYLEASASELFTWLAGMGVEWTHLNHQEGNRVPRWHAPRGGGAGLMRATQVYAQSLPIRWEFGTRVVELVQASGRVTGVVAQYANGEQMEFRAPAVLLASGGFNANPEMIRKYTATQARGNRVLAGGGQGATGGGHRMLEGIGAAFVNVDVVWMYPYGTPDPADPAGQRGLVLRGMDGDVWVNQRAERFHNEALRGGASGARALLAQEPPMCWAVIDTRIASELNVADPAYRRGADADREATQRLLDTSPYVARGATVAELAESAGLDRNTLQRVIAEHNRQIASGIAVDPTFGRPLAGLHPLEAAPFYAIQFLPLARKNFGGVRTDLECHVLRPDGTSIAGLFAAGEVAGMAGGHINGRAGLEGTMLGPSLYSGRVAGRAMVGAAHTAAPD